MRAKLSLNLDDLTVDSFDTTVPQNAKGTVFGEQQQPCTCYTNCTCPGCPTCANTCANTCAYTCDDATCAGNSCDTCYSCYQSQCDCSIDMTRCNGYICP